MHGLLHLDGKLWRTLPLLVLRPGRPTRAWIEGQRARHLSPVALFQSSIFLMFIVLGLAGPPARLTVRVDRGQALTMLAGAERQAVDLARGLDPKAAPALPAAARRALREAHAEAAALGQELATAPGPGGPWIEVPAD
ncbi:DUF3667 domain-containing protein [Thermaurantiacus sp.]|uniref:DUF3667 domain-containing protein n=1 Tax=Thermaurantiacus sp. TaxID=2820283 RepID=UPI00298F1197|nr:DUF3667 domain-containing protein [Thermaurantiacus sp.]